MDGPNQPQPPSPPGHRANNAAAPSHRIVFFGSGAFGLPTLQFLAAHHTVFAVTSQPDKPAGRGGKLTPTPIAEWAASNLPSVPLLKPENVNNIQIRDQVRAFPADAFVVIAFGQKLSPDLLADRFAINLHASLLPRWRGAAPINAAILAGDSTTGNSVITLADTMDAGLILAQSNRPIDSLVTAGELHDRLSQDGPDLVESVLIQHAAGTLKPRHQDPSLVTKARKLNKSDGVIDMAQSAEECRRRMHGLNPWPTVTVGFRGESLKLLRARVPGEAECEILRTVGSGSGGLASADTPSAGTFVDPERGIIACGGGTMLQLLEVQPAGKRAMKWSEFANGKRPSRADTLERGPAPC